MEKQKTPLSINIIYYVTQFLFYLSIIVTSIYLLFNIGLFTGIIDGAYQLNLDLPVNFTVVEQSEIRMNDTNFEVEFINATSEVHIIHAPLFIASKLFWWKIIILGLSIYMIWLFRKFITNVRNEIIFDFKNITHLKRIAYTLVAVWLFSTAFSLYLYEFLISKLEFDSIIMDKRISYSSEYLEAALFIWVIAHIFSVGLKLKEEQSLTI